MKENFVTDRCFWRQPDAIMRRCWNSAMSTLNTAHTCFKEPKPILILILGISRYRVNTAVFSPVKGPLHILSLLETPGLYSTLLSFKKSALPIYRQGLLMNKSNCLVSRETAGTFRLYAKTVLYASAAAPRMR